MPHCEQWNYFHLTALYPEPIDLGMQIGAKTFVYLSFTLENESALKIGPGNGEP